jgi:ComF family protein
MRGLETVLEPFLVPDPSVLVGDALTVAVAAFAHEHAAQRILRRLKYGGGQSLAGPLAALALPAFRRLLRVTGPAVLVPVPLHASRRRDRGYNQAQLIAAELGRRTDLAVWPALVRRRSTERQHGLDRNARLRNLRQAVELDSARRDGLATISAAIMVDDILTTGATFETCAAALKTAGVAEVYGFAIAREV